MGIMLYWHKRNFDTQKAERFFKERRIPYQLLDLKKHKLGSRELQLFAKAAGARALVDREGRKALERPVAHMTIDSLILSELEQDPSALVSPIVRNGSQITVGADEAVWKAWVEKEARG